MSGTSAAGVMGNIQSESGFAATAVEAENGQNYTARGYGLYQFTP
ncbi:phage tail tip lysozyme, partial [Streptococcus sanguinis]